MIAASAVLVVVAFVTLILGIFQSGLGLIWVSIASSVLAAIFLLLGVVQTRPKVAVAGGGTPGASPWAPSGTGAGPAVMERPEPEATMEEEAPTVVVPRAAPPTPARPSASRAPASRAPASRAPAKKPAGEATVVVIPDREKFHKESCRYAKSPAAMTMSKAAARKEGYKACGICKP